LHYAKELTIGKRKCGLSLLRLKNIADDFNGRNLDFCICLGDIITSVQDFNTDTDNIKAVAEGFCDFKMPHHIILGNHDLEAMSKSDYYIAFGKNPLRSYYSFALKDTKFIVLDANFNEDNSDYCKGNYNWTESYINAEQFNWLENELNLSIEENIIIFTHQNLDYRLSNGKLDACVAKNYNEVEKLLEKSNKKIKVFQGHYHNGDNQVIGGIEYITLKALCVGDDINYIPRLIVSIEDEISISHMDY